MTGLWHRGPESELLQDRPKLKLKTGSPQWFAVARALHVKARLIVVVIALRNREPQATCSHCGAPTTTQYAGPGAQA